jgi:hypothetical protein
MTFKPWTFFLVAIAGWMNRQQQEVIGYLTGYATYRRQVSDP